MIVLCIFYKSGHDFARGVLEGSRTPSKFLKDTLFQSNNTMSIMFFDLTDNCSSEQPSEFRYSIALWCALYFGLSIISTIIDLETDFWDVPMSENFFF